jgi:ABC-2 type transport system ATP-binding protein
LAQTAGLGKARVDAVIEQVGLASVARRRVGGFSLGMGQRVGIAVALLGRPRTIMLDEPVNGLDPEGVRWVRTLLRSLADQGCTVFVSSHLLGEMAETADRLVVIGRGRVIADSTVEEFVDRTVADAVTVRTPEAARLRTLLNGPGITITADSPDTLHVRGLAPCPGG